MRSPSLRLIPVASVILLAAGGCLSPVKDSAGGDSVQATAYRHMLAESVVDNWPPVSALAARRLLEQYGTPDEVRSEYLLWSKTGPWRQMIVRDVTPPLVQSDDLGVLEQWVGYALTPEQVADLAAFDRRLTYDEDLQELSARSDREELNFLRLNLADDVVNLRITPAQAQERYEEIIKLESSGKTSPYLMSLRFNPW